ncbi:phage protein NinX family protein [Paraburkholderia sp. J8-2]|uniref:phage protein NinX family protein n=1 Tax=Paraburkholderia sp. J8-2 TaxID=2805440 RepID=UPI002AB64EA6|nr:phage protein NinX family protein [Paraburkholderia sp. J8-2]
MKRKNEASLLKATQVSSQHGFDDYDIEGVPTVQRVTVGHGIRKGNSFNVYCDDGRKVGGVWQGSLDKSLRHLATRLESESATERNAPLFSRYSGRTPLGETSIDHIPLDEQAAYWRRTGHAEPGEYTDEKADELYSAWWAEQQRYLSEGLDCGNEADATRTPGTQSEMLEAQTALVTQSDIYFHALSRSLATTTKSCSPDGYWSVEVIRDLRDRRYGRALVRWKECADLTFEVEVAIFRHAEGMEPLTRLAADAIGKYPSLVEAFQGICARMDAMLATLDAAAAQPLLNEFSPPLTDREFVVRLYGLKMVPARYEYVWELEGVTSFPAYVDIETGLVFISHDWSAAERAHGWLLREEVVLSYPAAANQRSDHQISMPARRGQVPHDALDAFFKAVASTCCREREPICLPAEKEGMKLVKARDLLGIELDWAVAMSIFRHVGSANVAVRNYNGTGEPFSPSTNGDQAIDIIHRSLISVGPKRGPIVGEWSAFICHGERAGEASGPTPHVAALRCFVASELGSVVAVPTSFTKEVLKARKQRIRPS